jgi:hypothetical protein
MDLREQAVHALEHSRATDDYDRRRWLEEQKGAVVGPFVSRFGVAPELVTLGERYSLVIEHEGLRFTFARHSGEIRLLRTCPVCEKEVASPDVRDLEHLGLLLEDFSCFGHSCEPGGDSALRSALHRLVDVWVDQADVDKGQLERRRRLERALATALPFGLPRDLKRVS